MPDKIRPNQNQRSASLPVDDEVEAVIVVSYVWDSVTEQWIPQEPAAGGSGGVADTVNLSTSTLAALETISVANFPATQPVSGTLALDGPTLAALETITISNPTTNPETGLAKEVTLAALLTELGQKYEGGAIALDAPTLAALETISIANFPAVQPVSDNGGSLTVDGEIALDAATLTALETISVANFPATQEVIESPADTSAHSSFAASIVNAVLIAANANRRGLFIFNNNATLNLYIRFGNTAATTSAFSVKIPPGAFYEMPPPLFTGAVQGIWDGSIGNPSLVTEIT